MEKQGRLKKSKSKRILIRNTQKYSTTSLQSSMQSNSNLKRNSQRTYSIKFVKNSNFKKADGIAKASKVALQTLQSISRPSLTFRFPERREARLLTIDDPKALLKDYIEYQELYYGITKNPRQK